MWIDLSEWVKNMQAFMSYMNIHQSMSLGEEDFHDQVNRMTYFMDSSQHLSSAPLLLLQILLLLHFLLSGTMIRCM